MNNKIRKFGNFKNKNIMKKYSDYKKNNDGSVGLTNDEFNSIKWTKYKIVVPTNEDKKELENAFEHIHYADINTDYVIVNQIAHEYLNESHGNYKNNIIVDNKLFNKIQNK